MISSLGLERGSLFTRCRERRKIGVRVLPDAEQLLVGTTGALAVAGRGECAGKTEVRHRNRRGERFGAAAGCHRAEVAGRAGEVRPLAKDAAEGERQKEIRAEPGVVL